MGLQQLVDNAATIRSVVEGGGWQLDETIEELVASGQWELIGRLVVSGAEISARKLVDALMDEQVYEPLAFAGCLRRQPHQITSAVDADAGIANRVFADIDREEDNAGVPDHIRRDMEQMADGAADRRRAAALQEEAIDRDPVRDYIIKQLSSDIASSEEAMDAMVTIGRASVWEETRRSAALKIANNHRCVRRLCEQLRTDDIIGLCEEALLENVAKTFAKGMGRHFEQLRDQEDVEALQFIAENHPNGEFRDSAGRWAKAISSEEQELKSDVEQIIERARQRREEREGAREQRAGAEARQVQMPPATRAEEDIANCAVCGSEILEGDEFVRCPDCDTPHHADCWAYNDGCAVAGCSAGPSSAPPETDGGKGDSGEELKEN